MSYSFSGGRPLAVLYCTCIRASGCFFLCICTVRNEVNTRLFAFPWASYQISKIAGCACAGNAGDVFRQRIQKKPLISDPDRHHGTWVAHVPWSMSGSLVRGGGENVPGIPGACATRNFTYLVRGPWIILVSGSSAVDLPMSFHHTDVAAVRAMM